MATTSSGGAMSEGEECYTIIGRYADTGETTVTVLPYDRDSGNPHWAALCHTGAVSEDGEYEVVAVLRGRCEVLVTQQSLRLYAERVAERWLGPEP